MPDRADLQIYQGDDYAATVTVSNPDGTPADLSACTPRAQIREDVADEAPTVIVEIAATIAGSDVNLFIPHTDTTLLAGGYVWDLQLTDGDGLITTVVAGKVRATQEVTRPVPVTPLTAVRAVA